MKYRHVHKSSLRVQWHKYRHDESLRSALDGYVLEPLHSLFKDSKPLFNRLLISKYRTLPPRAAHFWAANFVVLYEQTLRDYKPFSAPLIGKSIAEPVQISYIAARFISSLVGLAVPYRHTINLQIPRVPIKEPQKINVLR